MAPGAPGVPVRVPNHLVFAILTTIFCCLPAWIVGIVFAAQVNGKVQAGDIAGAQRASKNAKTWSWVSLGMGAFWVLILAPAILIPNILRARMVANESSAVAAVRTLSVAEASYKESNPQTGFTCSLSDLQSAGLISKDIAAGEKNGYTFQVHACFPETPGGPNTEYKITASPIKPNSTGTQVYCSDESAVILKGTSAENCPNGAILQ